jgi:beta-xylosidase
MKDGDYAGLIALQKKHGFVVYLKIDCDFRNRTDKADFYYSLDGKTWTKIGAILQMPFQKEGIPCVY